MYRNTVIEGTSYVLAGIFLLACFYLHLMPTLISGITVYLLVTYFYNTISPRMKTNWANTITLLVLITFIVLILGGISFGLYSAFKVGNENMKNIGEYSFNILQEVRVYLPESLVKYIPEDFLILKQKVTELLKLHGAHLFEVTGHSLKALVHVIIGLILGAIIAFAFLKPEDEVENESSGKLKTDLKKRCIVFTDVFHKVILSQVKISAINTVLTAIYLIIILPLCGVPIPYAKTLVLITFVAGLIPVLGNLISNTLIFLISLTVGFKVAIASIVFLVVVHKLEYYINAKIVGEKIKTSIWELLLAMIIMETIFGVMGVVLAPVIYGYIKEELKIKNLI